MRTLTLGIATLQWEYGVRYDAVITGAAIATIAVIVVYSFARKSFIQGLTLTGDEVLMRLQMTSREGNLSVLTGSLFAFAIMNRTCYLRSPVLSGGCS